MGDLIEYDATSRVTKLTYPDSMQISYSYDDLNRITEIKRYVDGSNDEILLDGVQYNEDNLLTQFDYRNDLRATFTCDSRDRPLTLDVKNGETPLLDLDYTYDNNSNITQLVNGWRDTSSVWHSETESYSYDGVDRLTSASCTSWSHTYSYDKVGNRTAKDSVTYTVNVVNEVTSLSDGTTFTYDANGNRTQKTEGSDTWDYTYDCIGRLTEIKKNSATVGEYAYDGYGRRIQATENDVATTYIYSGGMSYMRKRRVAQQPTFMDLQENSPRGLLLAGNLTRSTIILTISGPPDWFLMRTEVSCQQSRIIPLGRLVSKKAPKTISSQERKWIQRVFTITVHATMILMWEGSSPEIAGHSCQMISDPWEGLL